MQHSTPTSPGWRRFVAGNTPEADIRSADVDDLLFNSGYLRDALAQQAGRMSEEVKRAPEDHVLHADVDAWVAALAERWQVEAPELAPEEDWYQDEPQPIQVDVSHEHFMRAIADPSTPSYIDGYRAVVRIPFNGDAGIFQLQPSSYTLSPPRGTVRDSELTQTIEYPHDRPADIRAAARALVNSVGTYLRSAAADIEVFNGSLEAQARGAIETRRQRILAHRQHVAATGLPTRKREDRNTTYVAEVIVRRPAPLLQSRSLDEPMRLEPVLADSVYEDVLGILRSACLSMERSPGTYEAMGEEDRRQVLLIPLNTQYRGQASAEAFNVTGKTDILLSWEGQNLFIAECKIWRGVKSFTDAVDQLFTYAAWRDTKLAVVMFVAQKNLSDVINKARKALADHEQFEAWGDADNQQELRATMRWPGDDRRLAELNVFLVHIPSAE
jgi:hypothetical protein